jgi:RNA polymerase sigma factor (sigma-70 family)
VTEKTFEQSYAAASRLVGARAASIVARYGLPNEVRRDLEQEALIELWRRGPAYDARRGSWRTFSERVVANRLTSLLRSMRAKLCADFDEVRIEDCVVLAAPNQFYDLRLDVSSIVAGLPPFDRRVAVHLMDYSAVETGKHLRISRAAVYRAIGRLRIAFRAAGFTATECHSGAFSRLSAEMTPGFRSRRVRP